MTSTTIITVTSEETCVAEDDPLTIAELLTEMVRAIVGPAVPVIITSYFLESACPTYHIDIPEEERGKVIGADGALIARIRSYLGCVSAIKKKKINILIDKRELDAVLKNGGTPRTFGHAKRRPEARRSA